MSYLFVPPVRTQDRTVAGSMFYRYNEGISVLKSGSTYTEKSYPVQEDFNTSDFVYQGGHEYVVSDAEAALLIAAGYSPTAI